MDTLADYVKARRDTDLAEIDAELARLPAAPDPDQIAAIGARLTDLGSVFPRLDGPALTTILAELGTVLVSGTGVQIAYDAALSAFVPAPCVEPLC